MLLETALIASKLRLAQVLNSIGGRLISIISIAHYREQRAHIVQDPKQCFLECGPTTHYLS